MAQTTPFTLGADVVTSFRRIWGTTPGAVGEIYRVLRPGGRSGEVVLEFVRRDALAAEKVDNQAVMVSLGRPGAGEELPLRALLNVVGYQARKPEGADHQ